MRIKTLAAAAAVSVLAMGANAGGLVEPVVVDVPVVVVDEPAGSSLPTWAILAIGAGVIALALSSDSDSDS